MVDKVVASISLGLVHADVIGCASEVGFSTQRWNFSRGDSNQESLSGLLLELCSQLQK